MPLTEIEGALSAAQEDVSRSGHVTDDIHRALDGGEALAAALRAVLHLHRPMPPLSNPDPTLNCYTCDEPSPCETVDAITEALT